MVSGSAEDGRLRSWLSAAEPVNVSVIVWAEFLCGPLDSTHADLATALFPAPDAFLAEDGRAAALLFNQTGRRRGSLNDCMIAAAAIRRDAALATNNVTDFRRFEPLGLRLVVVP